MKVVLERAEGVAYLDRRHFILGARCGMILILPHRAPKPVKVRYAQRPSVTDLDRQKVNFIYIAKILFISKINKKLTILYHNKTVQDIVLGSYYEYLYKDGNCYISGYSFC